MKKIRLLPIILCFFFPAAYAEDNDINWDNSSSSEFKLKQLIAIKPSASVIMLQMGERYKNLYWAAKQKKWEFAEYQLEEMEELIDMLIITEPNRSKTATEFRNRVFTSLSSKLKSKNWNAFQTEFGKMRNACMGCHAKNNYAFITLPVPKSANSPVLGMQ